MTILIRHLKNYLCKYEKIYDNEKFDFYILMGADDFYTLLEHNRQSVEITADSELANEGVFRVRKILGLETYIVCDYHDDPKVVMRMRNSEKRRILSMLDKEQFTEGFQEKYVESYTELKPKLLEFLTLFGTMGVTDLVDDVLKEATYKARSKIVFNFEDNLNEGR
jgi:hypothetical protein